uniref:Uncharacterized protein n=1 Tax=Arundo donax TaxID=35708 RepID=A0A0A9DT97_ARUDO
MTCIQLLQSPCCKLWLVSRRLLSILTTTWSKLAARVSLNRRRSGSSKVKACRYTKATRRVTCTSHLRWCSQKP